MILALVWAFNVYLMFVRHSQRCPNIKTILCQRANASRLLPVGWIDAQLIKYCCLLR